MSDLAERLDALAELNSLPLTYELTDDELKEKFLGLIAAGYIPPEAAEQLGKTGSWFRRFRSPKSQAYDPAFAERFEALQEQHKEELRGRLEKAGIEEALRGNARLIEKWLIVLNSPGWDQFRSANFQGEINIERLQMILPDIPTEILQQMREAIASKRQQKELPIIDAA
jgi:hypothetical protein